MYHNQITQVNMNLEPTTVDVFFVERESASEVSTQVNFSLPRPTKETRCAQTEDLIPDGPFSVQNLRNDDEFKAWTGITKSFFTVLVQLVFSQSQDLKTSEKQLLIFLSKLKTNLSFSALASLFLLSRQTVSKIFSEVLDLFYSAAKDLLLWLPKSVIQARMPQTFQQSYPNCRVVIDATEIKCEKPPTLIQQTQMFSNYKSAFTVKFLIGIAPSGEITFISKGYGGRVTDSFLTVNCGILKLFEVGDVVLADKGFPQIEQDVNNQGCLLIMPPFKRGDRQFSESENSEGYKCSAVRIHVELAIRRLKYFQILSFLKIDLIPHIDKILVVIAFLCNNMPDLIKS